MAWVWCPAINGWVAPYGPVPAGWTYPVDGTNDPAVDALGDFGSGELDIVTGSSSFDVCGGGNYWSTAEFVYYHDNGPGPRWHHYLSSVGVSTPSGTHLYIVVYGPNWDNTDPAPTWDPSLIIDGPPPPPPPAPIYVDGARRATGSPGYGLTTDYITFVGMADPPVAGDIVFAVAYQYNIDNPSLAVTAGWTVDAQHNAATGSWIVFHRAIETGDTGPTVSGITAGYYTSSLWTYRNFNGFDGSPAVTHSGTPVIDMDSGTISRSTADSITVAEWTIPLDGVTYGSGDLIYMPAGTDGAPDWTARHDTQNDKWYDNAAALPVAAGTFGPITAGRRGTVSPHTYIASPYVSVIYALRAIPGGGWGVGMIRMGAN